MEKIDPKSLGRVVVVLGGTSNEREVSLMSGKGVYEALLRSEVDAVQFDPKLQTIDELQALKADRAFLILHGKGGEDGVIQGVMEYIGLPYTGCGIMSSAIGIDKKETKRVWESEGIPVPKGMILRSKEDCARALETLGHHIVIKPMTEGSSIGLYRLQNATPEQVQEAFTAITKMGQVPLVEEFIDGRELTVPVLDCLDGKGLRALPIIEIRAPEGSYDYEHKYFSDDTQYLCPAPIDDAKRIEIQECVEKAAKALGTAGWARIDVMLRRDGSFALLEINTAPGMTPHSLVPLSAKAVGMSYEQLVLTVAKGAALKG